MISFSIWYFLGYCTGNITNEISHTLCLQQYEAHYRNFEGDDGFGLFAGVGKGIGRFYITDYIQKISGKRTVIATVQTNMCVNHHPFNRQQRYRFRPLMHRHWWHFFDFW